MKQGYHINKQNGIVEELEKEFRKDGISEPVFFYSWWKRACKDLGIEGIGGSPSKKGDKKYP